MKKPSFGVIVGRFQVHELHDGHMELIRTVRGLHDRVIIFLGIAPIPPSIRNPLDFVTRQRMIQAAFPDVSVLPLQDQASDEVWSKTLDSKIHEVIQYGEVTLYGGRDSFFPCYHGEFNPIQLPLTINKNGEEVRVEVGNQVIQSPDFRAGVIYTTQNRFPIVYPCVDIAVIDFDLRKVVLGRKHNESLLRFPGGHVNPRETFEKAAQRELEEETSLLCNYEEFKYIGSRPINDWRYNKEHDSITSAFFVVRYSMGALRTKDDLASVTWCELDRLYETDLVSAHRELFYLLKEHLDDN